MRIHPLLSAAGLALSAGMLGACDETILACSDEFRAIPFTIVDDGGAPVPDAAVTRTVLPSRFRPAAVITPTQAGGSPAGGYILVDDLSRRGLRETGDSIRVTAQRDAGPLTTATYFVTVPGGCHVIKVSGPDTLVVR